MEGPFNFETLSTQEGLEKKSRSLTKIESSFFRYVANYLEQLQESFRKEQERNAASKKAAFLSDELRNASNKADELWKAREKKIVQFAMVNARKDPLPPPPDNLTREEAAFYGSLLTLFREQLKRLIPSRGSEPAAPPASAPAAPSRPPPAAPPAPSPAPVPAAPPAPPAAAANAEAPDVQTIRATQDIPPFIGPDSKTYRIKKGEVVALPKKLANLLKERNQAVLVG